MSHKVTRWAKWEERQSEEGASSHSLSFCISASHHLSFYPSSPIDSCALAVFSSQLHYECIIQPSFNFVFHPHTNSLTHTYSRFASFTHNIVSPCAPILYSRLIITGDLIMRLIGRTHKAKKKGKITATGNSWQVFSVNHSVQSGRESLSHSSLSLFPFLAKIATTIECTSAPVSVVTLLHSLSLSLSLSLPFPLAQCPRE